MNKTELIAAVAEKSGLTRKDSEKAVLAALETITETLKTGEKVQLVGFGVFETRVRPAHKGHNPMTAPKSRLRKARLPPSRLARLSRKRSTNKVSLRDKSGVATKGHAALFLPFFYKFPHERAERGKGWAVVIGVHGKANLSFAVLKRHGAHIAQMHCA